MSKLVVLSLGNGDCEQGLHRVNLRISTSDMCWPTQFIGSLPPAPRIPQIYENWQLKYRGVGVRMRDLGTELNEPPKLGMKTRLEKPKQISNFSINEIEEIGQDLILNFNEWLRSGTFIRIRDRLFGLDKSEEIRLIIETDNPQLRLLPWHSWEFFTEYPCAEIALSPVEYDIPINTRVMRPKPRLLGIIGDSTGINIEADYDEIIQALPGAEIVFAVEKSRKEVYRAIQDHQGWDIVFFTGYGLIESLGRKSSIFINRTDSFTIPEIKNALQKAINRGLKLAIFNSCDGLGIASELASLHIPQVIVMREPVLDLVAQKFLRDFLKAFSESNNLYLAVRKARGNLEEIEDEFPCATWLPIICQNPTEQSLKEEKLLAGLLTFNEEEILEIAYSAILGRNNSESLERDYGNCYRQIVLLGDTVAGKTTYLAALTRSLYGESIDSPIQSIEAWNDDARRVQDEARNILEQGEMLSPTNIPQSDPNFPSHELFCMDDLPCYSFDIELKKQILQEKSQSLFVHCIDYPAPIFEGLLDLSKSSHLGGYLEDITSRINAIMFLIDGTASSKDVDYAKTLLHLFLIIARLKNTPIQRRIAVVFTKCELPELWLNRNNPRELALVKFPKTYSILECSQEDKNLNINIDYFTTSAFGISGTRFVEPNSKIMSQDSKGTMAVLKNAESWKPFGLTSPIYWLCTGQRYQELDNV